MYVDTPDFDENIMGVPSTEIAVNPGAPYMYLPQATCDAIANFIPVTYSDDFNVYLWNKDDPSFGFIVNSLHYLSFGFAASNGRTQTINVPFALLNLTFDSPLVSEPTHYFPCYPLPEGHTPTLGRAFLQAAFLGVNWHNQQLYLAQAPGPDHLSETPAVRTIDAHDLTLDPASAAFDWNSTWSTTVPPWDDANDPYYQAAKGGPALSTAAIAGIAVGGVVLLAMIAGLAFWFFRRRKQRKNNWTKPTGERGAELSSDMPGTAYRHNETYAFHKSDHRPVEIYEAEAAPPRQEADSGEVVELPAPLPGEGAIVRHWPVDRKY